MNNVRDNPSPRFSLRLLGGFALDRDAQPRELVYDKGRALLGYLAAEPRRVHTRASLAALLWPELPRDGALNNLRQILRDLRKALDAGQSGVPLLHVERETVRLEPGATLEIDAVAFAVADPLCPATPTPAHCAQCLAHMETQAGYYRGEYMAGFSLPECQDFEDWLHVQRETLHLLALSRLARLSGCYELMGAHDRALPFALRFLDLEPWNEEGLRRAMRLLALNGGRVAALSRYEACCRKLSDDIGVLPTEETQVLAERIRRGELIPAARRSTQPATHVDPATMAERRQVTVLYCELSVPGEQDPDEALAALCGPQAHYSEIIRIHSGYIVRVHGGGLLAYFGYPQASESAARLAVQAGLAVARTAFACIQVRAAVHTGLVIHGGDLQVPDAVGATSGLAMRLPQWVESGEVAISGATRHLVAGYFDCASLGQYALPGSTRSLEVFRVQRESGASSRLEAAARLTPLIGRKNELDSLLTAWNEACLGSRRVVLLRGDAGIGKSRLVKALRDTLCGQAYVVRELRCLPEYRQSPLFPLITLFANTLRFSPDDSPQTKFDKLANYVEAHYIHADQDAVPLLAAMLSLPLRAPYREAAWSAQQQRSKTLNLMLRLLYSLAEELPVMLVVEDLHWVDPSTLELIRLLVTRKHAAPILAVFTARPEFQPPWQEKYARILDLSALDDAEMATLVAAVAPDISPDAASRIVERADGIPLFAEELAREVAANDRTAIPTSLQDLLAARLDALGEAKTIAQAAATIGREFDPELLQSISHADADMLLTSLHQLQDAGILRDDGRTVFRFKHALIRDAAYQSQTRGEREAVHRRIAEILSEAGDTTPPEVVAQHWAAGGRIAEAIACWTAAGKQASLHSASREAVMHFKSGLALIEALPSGAERVRKELDLQIGLGAAACAAEGYASAEGADAYDRAKALCNQPESGPDVFPALWGGWASASSRAGYAHARELAEQLLEMAVRSGDTVQIQQAQFAVADTLYWQGEFTAAHEHLQRVAVLYRPEQHAAHVASFGEDAGVTSGSYLSWVLWMLGRPDQARRVSAQTLSLARQLGHPFSLAYAQTFAAILHCRLRQPEAALRLAREALDLANSHGFSLWQVGATLTRGWALALQHRDEGVELLRQCVDATRAAMGGVTLVVLEPLLEAFVILGRFDAALILSDEALDIAAAIGDRHIEAELHRLKGESLLASAPGRESEAEACFFTALNVSRQQRASSLELRAATSLVRLWQEQGKPAPAVQLLDEVLRSFVEGSAMPDFQDARQLLDSLRA